MYLVSVIIIQAIIMEEKQDYHTRLIDRYFQGKINDNESRELNQWLALSPDHMAQFDDFKERWRGSEHSLNIDENWKIVITKIQRLEQLEMQLKPKKRINNWRIVAAASILLFIAVSAWWLSQNKEYNVEVASFVFETPRGQRSKITLPDSSVIWLNADTKLEVISLTSNQRLVSLIGQAHFDVNRNKKTPFIVKTRDYNITVLGTIFDVMAYADINRTVTTLYEGKVRIDSEGGAVELKPGEQAIWQNNRLKHVEAGEGVHTGEWVNNTFSFDKVPLDELLMRLGRWYDIEFEYNQDDLQELVFSGTFKNQESVWQVLDVIKLYTPIDYTRKNINQIQIIRKQ